MTDTDKLLIAISRQSALIARCFEMLAHNIHNHAVSGHDVRGNNYNHSDFASLRKDYKLTADDLLHLHIDLAQPKPNQTGVEVIANQHP